MRVAERHRLRSSVAPPTVIPPLELHRVKTMALRKKSEIPNFEFQHVFKTVMLTCPPGTIPDSHQTTHHSSAPMAFKVELLPGLSFLAMFRNSGNRRPIVLVRQKCSRAPLRPGGLSCMKHFLKDGAFSVPVAAKPPSEPSAVSSPF